MLNFLATVYTAHPRGLDAAYREACYTAEILRRVGHRVFCPIENGHPLAALTGVDPLDWQFWVTAFAPWVQRCDRILVAQMDGWESSAGIAHEREQFRKLGKPEVLINPHTLKPL